MKVYEQQGKYIVNYEDDLRSIERWDQQDAMLNLQEITNWCRATWGDTDHRTNPEYKWRRRMFEFSFSRENHRTLFLMQFSNHTLKDAA